MNNIHSNPSVDDFMLSRIAAGEETHAEWNAFTREAERNAELWRELAETQRDELRLNRMGGVVEAMARNVDVDAIDSPTPTRLSFASNLPGRGRVRGQVLGWAVAALVMLAWALQGLQPTSSTPLNPVQNAGFSAYASARDAFQAYLTKGRQEGIVLSEAPQRILLETRPDPSGNGYELIYMQQIIERTTVPDVYRLQGQDESGRPTLVRYEQPYAGSM